VLDHIRTEAREIRAERDSIVFEEGERSDLVFVVVTGRIRVAHFRADGSVRGLCMMGDGDTFCCLPALDGGPYPATATAAVPSILIRIPGQLFRDLVEEFTDFGRAALHQFCGRLRENACEGCGVPDDATAKLAARILVMYRKFGEDVPLTRRELGELAGTTVETAIRVLKEFERSGWVKLARGRIRVRDPKALEATAQGSAHPVRLDISPDTEEIETEGPVAADGVD
jgi:CRP/FNR family transcriptional regulator